MKDSFVIHKVAVVRVTGVVVCVCLLQASLTNHRRDFDVRGIDLPGSLSRLGQSMSNPSKYTPVGPLR